MAQKISLVSIILFLTFAQFAQIVFAPTISAEVLYKMGGSKVAETDLNPSDLSRFNELKIEHFRAKISFAEDQILGAYYSKLAAKQKVDKSSVEKDLFKIETPDKAQLKKFYDENKDSIPYPYFLIKDKLGDYYKSFAKDDRRKEVLKKAMKSMRARVLVKVPDLARATIDVNGYPYKGNADAKHTLIEFADYQCPYCKSAHKTLSEVFVKLGKKIKFVYVDFFNPSSRAGRAVAQVAYCVRKHNGLDAYWAYQDHAYKNQMMLFSSSAGRNFAESTKNWNEKVKACNAGLEDDKYVEASHKFGESIGVIKTPTFFFNGQKIDLPTNPKAAIKVIRQRM